MLPTDDLKYGHQIITLWIELAWGIWQFAWYATASPSHVSHLLTVELFVSVANAMEDTAGQLKSKSNK